MQTTIADMYNTNLLEKEWWDYIARDGDVFSLKFIWKDVRNIKLWESYSQSRNYPL